MSGFDRNNLMPGVNRDNLMSVYTQKEIDDYEKASKNVNHLHDLFDDDLNSEVRIGPYGVDREGKVFTVDKVLGYVPVDLEKLPHRIKQIIKVYVAFQLAKNEIKLKIREECYNNQLQLDEAEVIIQE
jgi:hypothetical protein